MIKVIELIVVVTLMVFSFFIGVKYSDGVKSRAGWLFETKEEEVDLPDLTNEGASEVDPSSVYDNGAAMDNTGQTDGQNNMAAPMDDTSDVEVPAAATPETAAPVKAKSQPSAVKKQ